MTPPPLPACGGHMGDNFPHSRSDSGLEGFGLDSQASSGGYRVLMVNVGPAFAEHLSFQMRR